MNFIKKVATLLLSLATVVAVVNTNPIEANASVTGEGTSQSFSYTGGVQSFTAPFTGIYKLDVWGAQGNSGQYNTGGYGGYSSGYAILQKNQTIYICIGSGGSRSSRNVITGGYNGGGNANISGDVPLDRTIGSGGGATHITTSNRGVLKNYSAYQNEVLIVAGGGGGGGFAGAYANTQIQMNGGTGGGNTGGNGNTDGVNSHATGGTQTSGGYDNYYNEAICKGSFGQGGTGSSVSGGGGAGGGGGWYGGAGGIYYNGFSSGAGGSGYIGGVPTINYAGTSYSASTSNGINAGNGRATITLVKFYIDINNVSVSPSSWTNGDVSLTVNAVNASSYSIGGNYQTSPSFTVTENGTYTLYAKNEEGTITSETCVVNNIDKVIPTLSLSKSLSTWTNGIVTLTATASDGQSGIASYQWYKDNTAISGATASTYSASENATYKCLVKDNAGNDTSKEIVVSNIDKLAPTTSMSANITSLTNQAIKITANASDVGSGICNYSWYKDDSIIANENSEEITVSENGLYKTVVTDNAGNSATDTMNVTWIDKVLPTIKNDTEVLASTTKSTHLIQVSDNEELDSIEITLNGNLVDKKDISGKTYTHTYEATNNGSYIVTVKDKAGNISEVHSFTVLCIVKNYTLDEDASLYHVHYGSNNSTTINGCFNEPYRSYEKIGQHFEKTGFYYGNRDNNGNLIYCVRCGSWECPGHETGGMVDDYGYVTRYTCSKLNTFLGCLTLKKESVGQYVLSISDNLNSNAQIVSYNWHGEDTLAKDTSYPSVHPNGKTPSSVNGTSTSSITIPDFGYYTCTVTYRDNLSGGQYKIIFYYQVEDFDLTPPSVEVVRHGKTPFFDFKKKDDLFAEENDYENTVREDSSVRNDLAKRYISLSLADNMWLNTIECTNKPSDAEIIFDKQQLNKEKTDTVTVCVDKNGIYTFSLKDCMDNEYIFMVEIKSIDMEAPVIADLSFDINTWTNEDLILTVTATDNFATTGYYVSEYENESFEKCVSEREFTITENGIYYVYARDAIGNLAMTTINVQWIDREGPDLNESDAISVTINGKTYQAKANGAVLEFDLSNEDSQHATVNVKVSDAVKAATKKER